MTTDIIEAVLLIAAGGIVATALIFLAVSLLGRLMTLMDPDSANVGSEDE